MEKVPGAPRVLSGSPADLQLHRVGENRDISTIPAIIALSRRGVVLLRAKRAIEALLVDRKVFVTIPRVESFEILAEELGKAGVAFTTLPDTAPDLKATRERLDLTQEQFALRFGLDLDAVRNWEHGRRTPDTAARSYLRAIDRAPEAVEAALWGRA
jgi:putative transcriptional regulator